MSDRNDQNWKLGFGLLAGALLGYWLNSNQGRRVRAEMRDTATAYGEQAANYVREQADNIQQTTQQYYEQGKAIVDDTTTAVKNTFTSQVDNLAEEAINVTDNVESGIKKGIKKARTKVNNIAEASA